MIVISQNLVLSPAAESLSLNNPLFLYRNFVTAAGIVADTEEADYPASNLANPLTHSQAQWRAADATAQYVTFTISETDPADCLALAAHNLGSAEIAIRADVLVGGIWEEFVPEMMPADDAPLIFRVEEQSVAQFRIHLGAGNAPARIGYVALAPALIGQRRIFVGHSPITLARTTDVASGMSESSAFLGRVVLGEYNSTGIDLKNLTPDWYRENLDPFLRAARTSPFFFAWRPLDYPLEVGFCWLTNNPKPVNQRRRASASGQHHGLMSVQLQVNGIV